MHTPSRRSFLQYCLVAGLPLLGAAPVSADLKGYVQKPDSVYAWKLVSKDSVTGGTIYRLHLVSQTWQEIVWEHDLCVYQPDGVAPQPIMGIYNTGGGANLPNDAFGMEWAKRSRVPVAILFHIPKQPLFGDKREDALIAETFLRYLKTGDDTWPLLLPMVKSVIRAMDALQAFAKSEWKTELPQFIVTGASKRGWTTWLTAATGDKRVKAIAPMVIDTLNMPAQIAHQREYYGATSTQIKDYADSGLTDVFTAPKGKDLLKLVDPYSYRKALSLPKLLFMGANDPYWTADALRLYWNDLPGEKWVCYVPNAGHDLVERTPGQSPNRERVLAALSAFVRSQSGGPPFPKLTVTESDAKEKIYALTISANQEPTTARLWLARATTRDFRPSTWAAQSFPANRTVRFTLPPPPTGEYAACFAEVGFGSTEQGFTLCTPIRVLSP